MKIVNLIPGSRVAVINTKTLEVYFNKVARRSYMIIHVAIPYRYLAATVVRVRNGKYPLVPREYELAEKIFQENIIDYI